MQARQRREGGLRTSAVELSWPAVEARHDYGDAITACLDMQRPRDHDACVQQLCGIAVPVECCFALVGLGFPSITDAVAARGVESALDVADLSQMLRGAAAA